MFRKALLILFLFIATFANAQRIGKIMPPDPPVNFPSKASGFNLIFSENGFGFGGFYGARFTRELSGFVNITFSELKAEREIERYDYWGRPIVVGKVHRLFSVPILLGLRQRLFAKELADNLRPYVLLAVGPGFIMATDYNPDLFNSFNNPEYHTSVTGAIGFGGFFGLSKTNLIGLSFRYQYVHLLDTQGVETLKGIFKRDFRTFSLVLNIGWMFD